MAVEGAVTRIHRGRLDRPRSVPSGVWECTEVNVNVSVTKFCGVQVSRMVRNASNRISKWISWSTVIKGEKWVSREGSRCASPHPRRGQRLPTLLRLFERVCVCVCVRRWIIYESVPRDAHLPRESGHMSPARNFTIYTIFHSPLSTHWIDYIPSQLASTGRQMSNEHERPDDFLLFFAQWMNYTGSERFRNAAG